MENKKSIKKNMIMSIILTASNFVFPLITFSYVARVLTPIGTGKVAFVNSILSYFIYFAMLGVSAYGLREAAKVRDNKKELSKLVKELLSINLIATVISYIILIICVLVIPKLFEYKSLFLVMSITILLNSIGVEWLYKALEEYSYITTRSLIFKIIYVPLVFLLVRTDKDYVIYGFLSIFVSSANYICNFINIRKYVNIKEVKKLELKKHIKPLLILLIGVTAITVYNSFDISMLGFINTDYEVGLYNASYKIRNILTSLSTAITAVLIPRISYNLGKSNKEEVNNLVRLSLRTSMLIAYPIVMYCLLFSKNDLTFICGEDYLAANGSLIVLLICVFVLILTNLYGNQLMIPLGKDKQFSKSVTIGLFINIILNLLLIPKLGALGAAIGTLATEAWNAIYMGYHVREYVTGLFKKISVYKYIIASIIALAISYAISLCIKQLNLIYYIFITGIIFMATYYIVLILFKEEGINNEILKVKNRFLKAK